MMAAVLSAAELVHFKNEGFVVRRAEDDDPPGCRAALDALWAADSKPESIERDRPQTHGPLPGGGGWAARDVGSHPALLDFIPGRRGASDIMAIAEQLLGSALVEVEDGIPSRLGVGSGGAQSVGIRCRGVYATLPGADPAKRFVGPQSAGGCHNEGHPFQLGVVR
jgi:hypothetical protein